MISLSLGSRRGPTAIAAALASFALFLATPLAVGAQADTTPPTISATSVPAVALDAAGPSQVVNVTIASNDPSLLKAASGVCFFKPDGSAGPCGSVGSLAVPVASLTVPVAFPANPAVGSWALQPIGSLTDGAGNTATNVALPAPVAVKVVTRATLYLKPETLTARIGSTVELEVRLDTGGSSVSAVDVTIDVAGLPLTIVDSLAAAGDPAGCQLRPNASAEGPFHVATINSCTATTARYAATALAGSAPTGDLLVATIALQHTGATTQTVNVGFQAQGAWTTRAAMPTARNKPSVGAWNGIIYAAGGWNVVHQTVVEAYDAATNTWTAKLAMLGPQTDAAAGVIGGILHVAGGTNTSVEINTFTAYDTQMNSWASKPVMPTTRQGAAGGVINGKLYVAGGINSQNVANIPPLATLEMFDPTNQWSSLAPMPTARLGVAGGVVDGVFYVVGGRNSSGAKVATVEAYNPVTNTWSAKAPMPTAREFLAVEVINGVLYAIGGMGPAGTVVATMEAYDPLTNSWSAVPSMPTARCCLRAATVGGTLYAIGGDNAAVALGANEAFNPRSQAISSGLQLPVALKPASLTFTELYFAVVSYEGLGSAGDGRWAQALHVEVWPSSAFSVDAQGNVTGPVGTPVKVFSVTTSPFGRFAITGVPPGTYDVRVKGEHTLSRLLNQASLDLAATAALSLGALRPGDLNGDDLVSILDFSLFRPAFGRCAGETDYARRADLNRDTCVTIVDFSLMRTAFFQRGPLLV